MSTVTDTQVGKFRDQTKEDNLVKDTGDKLLEAAGTLVGGNLEIDELRKGSESVFDKHVKDGLFPKCSCDRLAISFAASEVSKLNGVSEHIAQMTDTKFFGSIDSGEGLNQQRREAQAAADAAAKAAADQSDEQKLMAGITVKDRQSA